MRIRIFLMFLIVLSGSCRNNPLEVDVSDIEARIEVIRFDTLFYGRDTSDYREVKQRFPYLFSPGISDSLWQAKMQDSLLLDLKSEVDRIFPGRLGVEDELSGVFQHIKYYFPGWKEPKLLTLYSDWDYMKRILLVDTMAFVFLDNYLGKENPVYEGIPSYIRQTMTKAYIPVDFAEKFAEQVVPYPATKDFLSKIIYHGKILYLKKALMPQAHDSLILGYNTEKYRWARENEKNVWLYFLDNDLLFDTDKNLDKRFIDPAPFSKFYSEADNESAGRIGRYVGLRIVEKYMEKKKPELKDLLRTDAQTIFNQSKYKP